MFAAVTGVEPAHLYQVPPISGTAYQNSHLCYISGEGVRVRLKDLVYFSLALVAYYFGK